MKQKVNYGEWLPHLLKDRTWNMTKSLRKNEFHIPLCYFQQDFSREIDIMSNMNFVLSSNNSDQLRELLSYFDRYLITSNQVAEAVEDDK